MRPGDPPDPRRAGPPPPRLRDRVSGLEWAVAGLVVIAAAALVVVEPDVLDAPLQSGRSIAFSVGGTVLAAVALLVMLRVGVPPVVRILVLAVPLAAVSWWLVSPYFVDEVVAEDFDTSIADAVAQTTTTEPAAAPATPAPSTPQAGTATPAPDPTPRPAAEAPPSGPVALGVGRFVGLAGHQGTGDAALFRLEDGTAVLRLENLDIENGPDLHLYLVPGRDQVTPADGSLYLGPLRGNVGDQTYDLPDDGAVTPGDWTVLVWCEAFGVEFVGATLSVA